MPNHYFKGASFQIREDLSLGASTYFIDSEIIVGGNAIFYKAPSFVCKNSRITANLIQLPYKENCDIENCHFSIAPKYLDAKYKRAHEITSYRFFEDGSFTIDLDKIKTKPDPIKIFYPLEEGQNCELSRDYCKYYHGHYYTAHYALDHNMHFITDSEVAKQHILEGGMLEHEFDEL